MNRKPLLNSNKILESAKATVDATGIRPTKNHGSVKYGPYAGKEDWTNINNAFHFGLRGLKYSPHPSLAAFLNHHQVFSSHPSAEDVTEVPASLPEPEDVAPFKTDPAPVTLEDVLSSALETYKETGIRPTSESGPVRFGALKDSGTTWHALDMAFQGRSGLLKETLYKSLYEALKAEKIGFYSARDIFNGFAAEIQRIGALPPDEDIPRIVPGATSKLLDNAFRRLSVIELETVLPEGSRQPRTLKSFFLSAGLARQAAGELVPVLPPPQLKPKPLT